MASSPKHVLTCLCSVGLALWLGTGGGDTRSAAILWR